MPSVIGRLALTTVLTIGALPSTAHARGDEASAAPSFEAGPGMVGTATAPFGQAVAPRSAVIAAPRQRVVVSPAHARNVVVTPQQRVVVRPQRVIVVPQEHAMIHHEHGMMAHDHRIFVVPETVLVVPQTPVYYVAAPYAPCIWCDELGCVRQTLDFCAMFAGP